MHHHNPSSQPGQLHGAAAQEQQQDSSRSWADLPADLLSCVGRLMQCPQQLSAATRVCHGWNTSIAAGVERLELDMSPCTAAFSAKLDRLQRLTPGLQRCKAHVSAAVPKLALASNVSQLASKLSIQHLDLELAEGYELVLPTPGGGSGSSDDGGGQGGAEGEGGLREGLSTLRSLTISGGVFSAAAAERLLAGLAAACPQLEELHLLPEPTCGLGDDQVDLLLQLRQLRVLELRAYRLTASGLTRLAALPALASLSCHGLDACLDAATAACFATSATLQQLHLGSDCPLPDEALARLRGVSGGLSMRFRWTDKLAGLMRTASLHLQERLVRLDLGAVRLARDPSSSLLEPLAALTALSDLRMRVHSNSETPITLHLSQLAALSNLQVLHLTKQHAYFPEVRRFSESNIAVPLSAAAAASLAAGCRRLRSLHLCLGASDVSADGLAALRLFSGLKSLSVSAEPFGSPSQPVPLDLMHLPPGLTSLELRNVDVITPAADILWAAGVCPDDGGSSTGSSPPACRPAAAAASAYEHSGGRGLSCSYPGAAATAQAQQQQQERGWVLGSSAGSSRGVWTRWQQQHQPEVASGLDDDEAGEGGDSGSTTTSSSRNALAGLLTLKLESCRLRTPQLQALALALPELQRLKLSHVAGLSDAGVSALAHVSSLQELSVAAPHNKALTQSSLAALTPLRNLRRLAWQSDDLTALGPCLAAFTAFTTLRHLGLSCSGATLDHACAGGDGRALLQAICPYATLDLNQH